MSPEAQTLSCRAAFISDLHLGARGRQAEMLLDFIRRLECEQLYLVDGIVPHARWLAFCGDWSYRTRLLLNTLVAWARHWLGLGVWSFSAYLKVKVKNALQFIENFEDAVTDQARRRGVDGVICGHIHKAEMRDLGGVLYVVDGDWVGSCAALVEHHDGRLEIVEWAKRRSWSSMSQGDFDALPEPTAA